MSIPPDFQLHTRKSPVTEPWEPLYSRRRDDGYDLAFEVRAAHCNGRGLLHGGVLAALCDNAMGLSVAIALPADTSVLTLGLAIDYLGSARVGDVVVIAPRVVNLGRTIAICDAVATAATRRIGRANASFTIRIAGSQT